MSFNLNEHGVRREMLDARNQKQIEVKPLRKQEMSPLEFLQNSRDKGLSLPDEPLPTIIPIKVSSKLVYEYVTKRIEVHGDDAESIAVQMNGLGWLNRAGNKWTEKQVAKWIVQISKPPVAIVTKAEVLALVFALPLSDNLLDKIAHLVRKEYV